VETVHRTETRAAIQQCLGQLREDLQPTWGSLTCSAMLYHLNAALSMALGELVAEPIGNPAFWHAKGKAVALSDERWPEGVRSSAEALPPGPVDFELERARFRVLLERVGTTDPLAPWPESARFGPMSGEEWSRMTFNHIRHHFRQFGVWEEETR
jgi:oxepin-CoA hydrolase / 3-oxo-5,6-dehydrosuberyl-CoA semialdehyde dehydrogenase